MNTTNDNVEKEKHKSYQNDIKVNKKMSVCELELLHTKYIRITISLTINFIDGVARPRTL